MKSAEVQSVVQIMKLLGVGQAGNRVWIFFENGQILPKLFGQGFHKTLGNLNMEGWTEVKRGGQKLWTGACLPMNLRAYF